MQTYKHTSVAVEEANVLLTLTRAMNLSQRPQTQSPAFHLFTLPAPVSTRAASICPLRLVPTRRKLQNQKTFDTEHQTSFRKHRLQLRCQQAQTHSSALDEKPQRGVLLFWPMTDPAPVTVPDLGNPRFLSPTAESSLCRSN